MEHVNNIMSKADMERLKLDNYQPITVTAGDPITIHAAGGISVEKFAENIKGVSYRITCNNGNQRPLINP